jgi:hypothetical protein
VKLLRATRGACNKLFQPPGFRAINRGSNAGVHIAYNPLPSTFFAWMLPIEGRELTRCSITSPRGFRLAYFVARATNLSAS